MNNSGRLMTLTTLSNELRCVDAIISSEVWMTSTTLGHQLRVQDAMIA